MSISKDAPFCTNCGQVRTFHESGLCCHCRRRNARMPTPCIVCGQTNTSNPDGICGRCRRKPLAKNYGVNIIDETIEDFNKTLQVLKKRKEGKAFSQIATEVGISKTNAYTRFNRAINAFSQPISDKFADPVLTSKKTSKPHEK